MRTSRIVFFSVMFVLILGATTFSQEPTPSVSVAPNAPKDKPVDATAEQAVKIEEAIKPYIERARKSYPAARDRFSSGLPANHSFFVTTRLHGSTGRFEQVFIAVREIKQGIISGLISSDVHLVDGYKAGDRYSFPESDLIDWTISRPDGTEEGNFVGKFLDTYQPESQTEPTTWRQSPATPPRMNQRIDEAASKYLANGPIPRIALYDIVYPKDAKEYADLDSHAVLLLTVLVQDQAELPLKKVYVLLDGQQVELHQFKQVLSKQSSGNSAAVKTFGAYRMDALYLVPINLRMKPSDLVVDFAQNRQGMKVATFDSPLPPALAALPAKTPTGISIQEALEIFVKREFPTFFQ